MASFRYIELRTKNSELLLGVPHRETSLTRQPVNSSTNYKVFIYSITAFLSFSVNLSPNV